MRMAAYRVISVRSFARIQQQKASEGCSMCRFSLAQLGNPDSRAIASCASLMVKWALKISASAAPTNVG